MNTPPKLVVVDVESTCWQGKTPPGQQNEIIEIGVCMLDLEALEVGAGKSILVKPQRSRVSEFCTQLTTLTQAMVDGGVLFADACAMLEAEYGTKSRVWGSWGAYDLNMFRTQCASFGVEYPFGTAHINIKRLFANLVNEKKQVGMARALQIASLPLDGTHHRGGDDALNIAKLLRYLIERFGLDILSSAEMPEVPE